VDLDKIHSSMTTKAVTSDELKLANEMIASYLEDSAKALKQAKELARQTGVPFKFDIEGLVVAFDPALEEAELEAVAAQKSEDEYWCSSDDDSWDSSDSTC
jgi:hypothetical protein